MLYEQFRKTVNRMVRSKKREVLIFKYRENSWRMRLIRHTEKSIHSRNAINLILHSPKTEMVKFLG